MITHSPRIGQGVRGPTTARFTAMSERTPHEIVEIRIPLRPRFASVARTVAASLGDDAGFSIDEIDDLRLAVSEVFNVLADTVDDTTTDDTTTDDRSEPVPVVRIVFEPAEAAVTVVVHTIDIVDEPLAFDPLASSILDSVLDELQVTTESVTLVKRAIERTVSHTGVTAAER